MAEELRRICAACGSSAPSAQKLNACSRCKIAFYCNKECQKGHWKAHKKHCKTLGQASGSTSAAAAAATTTDDDDNDNDISSPSSSAAPARSGGASTTPEVARHESATEEPDCLRRTNAVPACLLAALSEMKRCPQTNPQPAPGQPCRCCWDYCCNTAARLALMHRDAAAAKKFVQRNGSEEAVVEKNGSTLLSMAISSGESAFVTWLLSSADSAFATTRMVNQPDQFGAGPLMKASANGLEDIVELLLERGARMDVQDEDGWTALHSACHYKWPAVAKVLVQRAHSTSSAEECSAFTSILNKKYESPACHAVLETPASHARPGAAQELLILLAGAGAKFSPYCRRYGHACIDYMCQSEQCLNVHAEVGGSADERQDARASRRACGNCGVRGAKLRCSKCRSVYYCTTKCQRAHWNTGGHKSACNTHMLSNMDHSSRRRAPEG